MNANAQLWTPSAETRKLLEGLRNVERRLEPLDKLPRVCRKYGLKLIVLFGSHVKDRVHPNSDVDIAVLPEKRRRPNLLNLYVDLVPFLGSDRLDIVDLRRAPPLLAWNVAREGLLLYEAQEGDWTRFRIRAMKNYDDVRRFEKLRLAALDRSLREWGVLK